MNEIRNKLKELGVVPRLKLMVKDAKGIPQSTGPHRARFVSTSFTEEYDSKTRKMHEVAICIFEEGGEQYRYHIPVLNETGQPHYLLQRLGDVEEGDELILEAVQNGGRSYIGVQKVEDGAAVTDAEDIEADATGEEVSEEGLDPKQIPF